MLVTNENDRKLLEKVAKDAYDNGYNKALDERYAEIFNEGVDVTYAKTMVMVMWCLRNNLGLGHVRLLRFLNYFADTANSINEQYLTLKDIDEQLEEEIGFSVFETVMNGKNYKKECLL